METDLPLFVKSSIMLCLHLVIQYRQELVLSIFLDVKMILICFVNLSK